jgi:hypothetical protein
MSEKVSDERLKYSPISELTDEEIGAIRNELIVYRQASRHADAETVRAALELGRDWYEQGHAEIEGMKALEIAPITDFDEALAALSRLCAGEGDQK